MSFNTGTDMIRVILVAHFVSSSMVVIYFLNNLSCSGCQNGKFLNVNNVDPNLKSLELNADKLGKVFLGKCDYDGEGCTTPGAMYADYNAWLGELSTQELVDWTSCS